MLVLQLKAELSFYILLKTHAKNVSVDRKLHLLGNAVKLRLLPLNNRGHLVESLLKLIFMKFARTHLLNQALLVDIRLCSNCLVMAFKVGEDFMELLFFSVAGLKRFLYCE